MHVLMFEVSRSADLLLLMILCNLADSYWYFCTISKFRVKMGAVCAS